VVHPAGRGCDEDRVMPTPLDIAPSPAEQAGPVIIVVILAVAAAAVVIVVLRRVRGPR